MTTEEKIIKVLRIKGMTLSAGESVTGGMFISSLISAEGASSVIGASFVTYSDTAKVRILNVSQAAIKECGAVSEQVAGEMAIGAAKVSGADIGVGITGYAGPSAAKGVPVGTVCFGFSVRGFTSTVKVKFDGDRNHIRKQAVSFALSTLYNMVK